MRVKLNVANGEDKQVLYADGTMLVEEVREHPQHIVNEFERQCDSMVLQINVRKNKVLVVKKDQMKSYENVRVSGE